MRLRSFNRERTLKLGSLRVSHSLTTLDYNFTELHLSTPSPVLRSTSRFSFLILSRLHYSFSVSLSSSTNPSSSLFYFPSLIGSVYLSSRDLTLRYWRMTIPVLLGGGQGPVDIKDENQTKRKKDRWEPLCLLRDKERKFPQNNFS